MTHALNNEIFGRNIDRKVNFNNSEGLPLKGKRRIANHLAKQLRYARFHEHYTKYCKV